MQLSRLFEIVYLLLNRKSMTAKELAAHFEVSQRTIYRDVETLAQAGVPIFAVKGANGGIRLTENYVFSRAYLSADERQNLLSSLRGMGAVQPEAARPVLSKLSALFGQEGLDWIEVDFSLWGSQNPVSERFSALKAAIFAERLIQFDYSGMSGGTALRTVEPMKLIFRGMSWYLLGFCRDRQAFRYFKLLRMDNILALPEPFTRRPLPDLKARENRAAAPMAELTVRVSAAMEYRVREEFPKEQWEREEDGSFLLRFSMPDNAWLMEYLTSYGEHLTVLAPERIRRDIAERLKNMLRLYEI
ncbi:MAG TPA: YafY family protein [Feifaniaceae bacterium]|nr:YafY family protein [Feifaniaceae bacterium]